MNVDTNKKKRSYKFKSNIKLIIIVIIVLLILFLSLFLLFFRKKSSILTLNSYFDESEQKIVKNCKLEDTDECLPVSDDIYLKLVLSNSYPVLDEKVDSINYSTENLYELAMKSDMSSDDCVDVRDKYLHQLRFDSIYNTYEDDKYVSVAVQRYSFDVCTNGFGVDPIEVYIYDISKKKIISQSDFINALKITDKEVKDVIDKDMANLGEEYVQDKYNDITYYYGSHGELYATYMSDSLGTYYTSVVREPKFSFTSDLRSPEKKK